MKRFQLFGLSILSGILLFAAWPVSPLTFAVFLGFVPLLFVADAIVKKNVFFCFSFLALCIWNTSTTWWIWNSTDVGSIAAIIANSVLMCLPWWGYFTFKKIYGKRSGYIALVAFWMLFEYIHLNWQLSWPWLTLGNVFASHPSWVQWYEYTGVSGGTLWILIVNIALKEMILKFQVSGFKFQEKANGKSIGIFIALISIPFIFSAIISQRFKIIHPINSSDVVIIQPNIDPYQKFNSNSIAQQVQILVRLSEQNMDSSTKLIIWPETAMSAQEEQGHVAESDIYKPVFNFINQHPNITIISGIETYKMYGSEKYTATSRLAGNGNYYDVFNAAVAIKANQPIQFYNKSKLVPGVESLPTFLNFLGPIFEKFGGSTGGYGKSDSSKVFTENGNPYVAAPVICYESIYGEYVASYVQRGANMIAIITNDGWWGNTPGHKQHLQYARLRAIETRRWVARSANTGISAVINDRGDILTTQPWNKEAALKYNIPTSTTETVYVAYGDYLYKLATVFAALLLGWHIAKLLINRFVKK
ncbi:apolipoprotein N-acyltransferase [Parasediminibacterium paludis]|uniref:Apolipoprotein N-acyltransferase n=1 Tax=Parasediminibacterium paludis TaxID=908966 RepID=A0ABV8PV64_9BACT